MIWHERFNSKVDRRGQDECWPWLGTMEPEGYGVFAVTPRMQRKAHRLSYEKEVGPIPEGLTIDHTCHDPLVCPGGPTCPHRRCVNPRHLEPVTRGENARRGNVTAQCSRGHPWTEESTRLRPDGRRSCRICHREWKATWRATRSA